MLLPAFGLPTSPTSAMIFSSSRSVRASPSPPGVDSRGSAVDGGLEPEVPLAAAAALGHDDPIADGREVLEHETVPGVMDDGAGRNADHQVLGRRAVALRPSAGLTAFGLPVLAVRQGAEAVDVLLGHEDDAAAVAAVAAVGPAAGNVLLPAEADASVAASAGFHLDFNFVDEHGVGHPPWPGMPGTTKNGDGPLTGHPLAVSGLVIGPIRPTRRC